MITITKNGFVLLKDKIISNNHILSVISDKIILDKDFNLRSFFKMFINYPKLISLEAYLLDYVDLYSRTFCYSDEIENNDKIIFNNYFVKEYNKCADIRHNLIFQNSTNHKYTIDSIQLERLIDCKFVLSNKLYVYDLINIDNKKIFNQSHEIYTIEYPCNLFEFILWSSGSLFKGTTPINRIDMVNSKKINHQKAVNDVMKNIDNLLTD